MPEDRFHKPARMPSAAFDFHAGGEDPAITVRRAHESARALLARIRDADEQTGDDTDAIGAAELVDRVVRHTDEHGLDLVAQLWSRVDARTLPGALWRLYLLRAAIREDPEGTALAYSRGAERLATIDPVVAGAAAPTGPEEVLALADEILRGAFRGDLGAALDRAGAYCRVAAEGWLQLADARDAADPAHASVLTTRAARLRSIADELDSCARLERRGTLD